MAEGRVVAAEEIAVVAMRDKGLDPEDRKTRSDFIQRVLNTLTAQKGKGTVEKIGNGLAPSGRTRRSRRVSALPVAAEVDRRAGLRHQPDHDAELLAVTGPAVVFPERSLIGVAVQVEAREVMMVPDLPAADAREKGFRPVGAG